MAQPVGKDGNVEEGLSPRREDTWPPALGHICQDKSQKGEAAAHDPSLPSVHESTRLTSGSIHVGSTTQLTGTCLLGKGSTLSPFYFPALTMPQARGQAEGRQKVGTSGADLRSAPFI